MIDIEAVLKDPKLVHRNMLMGRIALPSIEDIIHLYGASALRAALAANAPKIEDGDDPRIEALAKLLALIKEETPLLGLDDAGQHYIRVHARVLLNVVDAVAEKAGWRLVKENIGGNNESG